MTYVSLIIINYNSEDFTLKCLQSIVKKSSLVNEIEIIIVDNASNYKEYLKLKKNIKTNFANLSLRIIRNKINTGFGSGNMIVFEKAKGKYVVFLNNDTVLLNDCISILFTFMELNPKVALCGPQAFDLHQKLIPSFDHFISPFKLIFGRFILEIINSKKFPKRKRIYLKPLKVNYVEGSFMFFRAENFISVNGFDKNIFLYYEENDICLRLHKKGHHTFLIPEAKYIHHRGGSTKRSIKIKTELKISLFYIIKKHFSFFTLIVIWIYFVLRYLIRIIVKPSYWYLFKTILFFAPLSKSLKNEQIKVKR